MSRVVVPYALWPDPQALAAHSSLLSVSALPGVSAWWRRAHALPTPLPRPAPRLSMPHEWMQAQAGGGAPVDGLLPWAALAAAQAGHAHAGDGSAWGFVTLCHWQVSHGLATLTDPADLALDDATDAALFEAMHGFFAEDGLSLRRWQPGVWLVRAPMLAHLPTAALPRVVGQDVEAWWVGGDRPSPEAALWRRLQNEMQMLLYTHPVNAQRRVPVNSFWLHGTGAMPMQLPAPADALPAPVQSALQALQQTAWQHDLSGWCHAWQALDRAIDWSRVERLCLCGWHEVRLYQRGGSVWQRWWRAWQDPRWAQQWAEAVDTDGAAA